MADNRLTLTEASLNPATADLINIKINGQALQVPKNENVIESCKRVGVDVPYFCYHPRLSKGDAANCRMCLIEVGMTGPDGSVRKMPKPQTACTLPAAEGMVIETDTEMTTRDRRGVLEFILINHPLDCPICDRGGECPLQNNTIAYGPSVSRYTEEKRHYPKAYPLSDHVVFDRERCIHCARCTRFTEDISGDAQLGFLKRGGDMEVGTFAHTKMQSKFSGNVIELCPVGALLSRDYRFKARPWDLNTQRSVCSKCSNGCNIKIDHRLSTLQRVNARLNEAVNEEWTCDRGKFGHAYVSSPERLQTPMLRQADGTFAPIAWADAYRLIVEKAKAAGANAGAIGGARLTNEDNYVWQRLMREGLKTNNLDSRLSANLPATNGSLFRRFGYHTMGNTIADLETMKAIFVIGSDLADEQPILFLRVRKAWRFRGASVINAVTSVENDTTQVGDFAAVQMIYRPGSEIALLNGLLNVLFTQNLLPLAATPIAREGTASASKAPPSPLAGEGGVGVGEGASAGEPSLAVGTGPKVDSLRDSVAEWTPARTEEATGVPAAQIVQAANLLVRSPMAILAGKTIQDHPQYDAIVAALGNLIVATGNEGNLNLPGTECNSQGAADMGVLPDAGPGYQPLDAPGLNTREMLEAAASGKLQLLWIAGADPIVKYADSELARRALEACPFVIVNELNLTRTAAQADLILPAASMAEKDGTYTNCERRVQRIYKAFDVATEIKPDWLIFAEALTLLTGTTPYFSARDILRDIAAHVPPYAGLTPKSLGESGVRWNYTHV